MNEALKTIENILQLAYNELNRVSEAAELSDKAFEELKDAKLLTLELKHKVELVRAWNRRSV